VQNAVRDGAEWAWVPSGDSCAFCIALASRGWETASQKALKGNHAQHIHANCDCAYAIRFDGESKYESYDPAKYKEIYDNASDGNSYEKINAIRREKYKLNKDEINASKRINYESLKERSVSGTTDTREQINIVKAGRVEANGRFLNNQEKLYRYAANVEPIDNYSDFTCHADPDNFYIDMKGNGREEDFIELSAHDFADAIKNSRSFTENKIRIISCQAGAKADGAAQKLADELQTAVLAPTEIVNIDENGEMFLCDNDILAEIWYTSSKEERTKLKEPGRWVEFTPRRR
jgi:hypothetical protein